MARGLRIILKQITATSSDRGLSLNADSYADTYYIVTNETS